MTLYVHRISIVLLMMESKGIAILRANVQEWAYVPLLQMFVHKPIIPFAVAMEKLIQIHV